MPYFPFFLKSFSFLCLDFELSVSKRPYTLSSCLEIILSQKPDKIIFDLTVDKSFENYHINLENIVQKIRVFLPKIKIEFLENIRIEKTERFQEKNQVKIQEIIKYIKRNEQELFVVQDLVQIKEIYKILNQENYGFWFYNFKQIHIKEIIKLKKNYFDLNFLLSCNYLDISVEEVKTLAGHGLEKLIIQLNSDCEFLNCFQEHFEKIESISNCCKLKINIYPNLSQINNQSFVEFLNLLDSRNLEYQIMQTTGKIENKKEFINFGVISLLSSLDKDKGIIKRLKEIPIIPEKKTVEHIIDFILRTENKYLEFYIDIAHFLDGFFTKEEIIDYLNKLHPNTKKENLEKIVYECINLLEKEMFVDYLNSKKEVSKNQAEEPKSHYVSVFPRLNNLFLMYSGSEKGYIFGKNTKKLEEVPRDIFFFFVFSKGIFVLKEVAHKLHLLFKDTKEFSTENYLKSTKKIYNTLKHYGLCK